MRTSSQADTSEHFVELESDTLLATEKPLFRLPDFTKCCSVPHTAFGALTPSSHSGTYTACDVS